MTTRTESIGLAPAANYRGTFAPSAALPESGAELPPGWEGLFFAFDAPLADLREDGSPARDGVLPEIDLPRRMYAGEDTVFHRPVRYGDEVVQQLRAGELVEKNGRSGRLVFADIVREYLVGGELAIESVWHDVFLEASSDGASRPPARAPEGDSDWAESVTLDERQLFRFSALTFNTHRVHYDRDWALGVEGLDGLLVHGPLLRILLLDAALRNEPGIRIASFSYRSHAPVLVGTAFELRGRRDESGALEILVVSADGGLLARGVVGVR